MPIPIPNKITSELYGYNQIVRFINNASVIKGERRVLEFKRELNVLCWRYLPQYPLFKIRQNNLNRKYFGNVVYLYKLNNYQKLCC